MILLKKQISEALRMNNMYVKLGSEFENLMCRILELAGYTVKKEVLISDKYYIDIIAYKEEKRYYLELKTSTSGKMNSINIYRKAMDRVYKLANMDDAVPVFAVLSVINKRIRKEINEIYPNMVVLDISNILFEIKGTKEESELIALAPFALDAVDPEEGHFNLKWLMHYDDTVTYIHQLDNCPQGREGATEFEKICTDILKYIFDDDLTLWDEQGRSNNNLYRFDLLCRIKDNNSKTFWKMMEEYFKSKYIIFEFKNYKDEVSQKEIYTTERYLYRTALRNVAIIIARNGYDDNSQWAAKGSLREAGKLILLLDVVDLSKMIEMKKNQDDPSSYILSKLDYLLENLEK